MQKKLSCDDVFLSFLGFLVQCFVVWFICVCLRERNTRYSIDDSSQQNTKLRMIHSLSVFLKAIGCSPNNINRKRNGWRQLPPLSFSIACVALPYWGTERVFHVARRCPTCAFEINEKLIPSIRFKETLWMDPPPKKKPNLETKHTPPTYLSLSLVWNRDIN